MDSITKKVLLLAEIRRDGGTQARAATSSDTIEEYATLFRDGKTLGELVVFYDGTEYWLGDGFHRILGAEKAGVDRHPCEIRRGTLRDAKLYACGANSGHGLRRSPADRRQAIALLLSDPEWRAWSDSEVARACDVTHPLVKAVRAELYPETVSSPKKGADGKVRRPPQRRVKEPQPQLTLEDVEIIQEEPEPEPPACPPWAPEMPSWADPKVYARATEPPPEPETYFGRLLLPDLTDAQVRWRVRLMTSDELTRENGRLAEARAEARRRKVEQRKATPPQPYQPKLGGEIGEALAGKPTTCPACGERSCSDPDECAAALEDAAVPPPVAVPAPAPAPTPAAFQPSKDYLEELEGVCAVARRQGGEDYRTGVTPGLARADFERRLQQELPHAKYYKDQTWAAYQDGLAQAKVAEEELLQQEPLRGPIQAAARELAERIDQQVVSLQEQLAAARKAAAAWKALAKRLRAQLGPSPDPVEDMLATTLCAEEGCSARVPREDGDALCEEHQRQRHQEEVERMEREQAEEECLEEAPTGGENGARYCVLTKGHTGRHRYKEPDATYRPYVQAELLLRAELRGRLKAAAAPSAALPDACLPPPSWYHASVGGGAAVHAVPQETADSEERPRALCGQRIPYNQKKGWTPRPGTPLTCRGCVTATASKIRHAARSEEQRP